MYGSDLKHAYQIQENPFTKLYAIHIFTLIYLRWDDPLSSQIDTYTYHDFHKAFRPICFMIITCPPKIE